MKKRVAYLRTTYDTIQADVNAELEAIQINVKNTITKITPIQVTNGVLVQIEYNEDEVAILNEEVITNVN